MMPIIAFQIGHFNAEYILYFAKGKPSGPGSAYACAFFHPRCRCKSRNVVQWSLVTVNLDESKSMN
jgi:hypothetical protein